MIWAPALQLSFCPICWRKEEIVTVKVHNIIVEEFGLFLLSRPFVACNKTPRFPQSQACVCGTAAAQSSVTSAHHDSTLPFSLQWQNQSSPFQSQQRVRTCWPQLLMTKSDMTSQYSAHFHRGLLCKGKGFGSMCFGKGANVWSHCKLAGFYADTTLKWKR